MEPRLIGAKACRPNDALSGLGFLVGIWSTVGMHPAVPEADLPGWTRFDWSEGGAFLVMRSETDHKDFPDGIAIFSSDKVLGQITMSWFDQRGVSRLCPVSLGNRSVSWHHDDPDFLQRMTITADPDGQRMVSSGQMAKNGGDWEQDLSQIFLRQPTL